MRDVPRLRATPAARSQASSILSAAATGLVSFILLEAAIRTACSGWPA